MRYMLVNQQIVIESVELATAEGSPVIPALADGLIVVNLPATETPIPSSTATFTHTPTITLTAAPTQNAYNNAHKHD